MRGSAGDIVAAVTVFIDIEEQRRAEERLRESEARFRLMADAVAQIVWIIDRHGPMEFLNRQFVNYTGASSEAWTPAEMAARFIPADDGVKVVAAFEAALRTVEPFERSTRPTVSVLLVSGYAEREASDPDFPRLTKPFRKDELAAGLAQLSSPD